jgi:hypothetical protein
MNRQAKVVVIIALMLGMTLSALDSSQVLKFGGSLA